MARRIRFANARYRTVSPGGTIRNFRTLKAAIRAGGNRLGWKIQQAVPASDGSIFDWVPLRSYYANPSKRSVQKRVSAALKKWLGGQKKKNPCSRVARGKGVTLRNMASVTIRRLPGGAVAVTGRKMVRT